MEVTVNQENYRLIEPCSVEQMLGVVQAPLKGIAVAINQTIVAKSNWADHALKQGDQIMLIKATQGG